MRVRMWEREKNDDDDDNKELLSHIFSLFFFPFSRFLLACFSFFISVFSKNN